MCFKNNMARIFIHLIKHINGFIQLSILALFVWRRNFRSPLSFTRALFRWFDWSGKISTEFSVFSARALSKLKITSPFYPVTSARSCHSKKVFSFIFNENILFWGHIFKFKENKLNRVQTTDAFWRSASVLVSELSFKWHSLMFLTLFCSKSAHFSEIQLVCDGWTDRPTAGQTHPRIEMQERI